MRSPMMTKPCTMRHCSSRFPAATSARRVLNAGSSSISLRKLSKISKEGLEMAMAAIISVSR
jgi:hypothetical protein